MRYSSNSSGNVHYKYQVCTRDGYLKGNQHRTALKYEPHLTAELMMIDETKTDL